jgi:SulP family sulfate permease
MLTTMLVTISTRNFALGVATGIVMSTVLFSRQIAQLVFVDKVMRAEGHRVYSVSGHIFFVSSETFLSAFDGHPFADRVTIDLTHAHLWDQGAVAALDTVVHKLRRAGAEVDVVGLNPASAALVKKLAVHSHPGDASANASVTADRVTAQARA